LSALQKNEFAPSRFFKKKIVHKTKPTKIYRANINQSVEPKKIGLCTSVFFGKNLDIPKTAIEKKTAPKKSMYAVHGIFSKDRTMPVNE